MKRLASFLLAAFCFLFGVHTAFADDGPTVDPALLFWNGPGFDFTNRLDPGSSQPISLTLPSRSGTPASSAISTTAATSMSCMAAQRKRPAQP